jgi:hypothetical protein
MRTVKHVLRPERLRQVPEQFSWVDQALVQRHFIDRCDARAAALYLFLVTVADAQGLSYYGEATLTTRLHLCSEELVAARQQLITIGLIAYQAPLYQVLALSESAPPKRPPVPATPEPERHSDHGAMKLAQILDQMRRRHAQL